MSTTAIVQKRFRSRKGHMLTAPILYVGDDICRRIPVIERYGARVRRTPCSASELREALSDGVSYAAVAFHEDTAPLPPDVLAIAGPYPAPLVLFENGSILYDPSCFDLIIPTLTPPGLWLRSIQEVINDSRKLRAESQALRRDAAAVRAEAYSHQSRAHQLVLALHPGKLSPFSGTEPK